MNNCTEEVMVNLITVYDAADDLFRICSSFTGVTIESGLIVYQLLEISEAIKRFSPLYDPSIDWEDSEFVRILDDRTTSKETRAKLLLGYSTARHPAG